MRLILTAILSCGLVGAQTPNTLSEAEKRAGWELLFDGKSWAGWDFHVSSAAGRKSVWSIEDGWIRARARDLNSPVRRFASDVPTKQLYSDFEFSFEWKLPVNGNSGVKYRVQGYLRPKVESVDRPKRQDLAVVADWNHATHDWQVFPIGFEYQIYDDALAKEQIDSATGSLYGLVAPNRRVRRICRARTCRALWFVADTSSTGWTV